MELKSYQQEALEALDRYLEALETSRKKGHDNPKKAWKLLRNVGTLPSIPNKRGKNGIPEHIRRKSASGKQIPHVCMKIPTGGGKTLLGVETLRHLKIKTGLVLWIVPTNAIYRQTWDTFRDKDHPYRQVLTHASSGHIKLLQKQDNFTLQDVQQNLCVMVLSLHAANRKKEKGNEFLKIFRNNSADASFFPVEDDIETYQELLEKFPDLDTYEVDQQRQSDNFTGSENVQVTRSLHNVIKMLRPVVILDEAHKAYGVTSRASHQKCAETVNRFNPRFVLELTATPKVGISNILVNTSGLALKSEEMIKLPIQLRNFPNGWKFTLAKTKEQRDKLEQVAEQYRKEENRYIRPIALIRVQLTGKNQQDKNMVHVEDVRKELINILKVPEEEIKVKSSTQDELAGIDLMSDKCPVRYIITKDALKEGWDCPFAYILALLDTTTAQTAMTQMVGRVLRQPHAHTTNYPELNSCYIYCYNQDVKKSIEKVKEGLESVGLTGLDDFVKDISTDEKTKSLTIERKKQYLEIQIFLPKVLHKRGKKWDALDYDRDILGAIDWHKLEAVEPVNWEVEEQYQTDAMIDLQQEGLVSEHNRQIFLSNNLDVGYFIRRLSDIIPNPWHAARIVKDTFKAYKEIGVDNKTLSARQVDVSEDINNKVRNQIEKLAEEAFLRKIITDQIRFRLDSDLTLNYQIGNAIEVKIPSDPSPLTDDVGDLMEHNLFEKVFKGEFNNLEENFAVYLDKKEAFQWWHRVAAKQDYFLQGWRRDRVYPDFVACLERDGTDQKRLVVFETKGLHLAGNTDTTYKEKLFKTLEAAYNNSTDHGEFTAQLPNAKTISFRLLFEDTWKASVDDLIAETD
ncbi:MAG: DEAD/DEAH box helicase family protein [Candidatus Poribacteria bacterium]|nr:DEAD/DEAH box helicase family protein [Candidatus Poribacteria bacterium]